MLLQSLIDTPEKVERATRRQAELETLVLAAGGIAGPGSLGEASRSNRSGERLMKKILPEAELARDERFVRSRIEDAFFDPRGARLADRATPAPPRWPPTGPPRPSARAR